MAKSGRKTSTPARRTIKTGQPARTPAAKSRAKWRAKSQAPKKKPAAPKSRARHAVKATAPAKRRPIRRAIKPGKRKSIFAGTVPLW